MASFDLDGKGAWFEQQHQALGLEALGSLLEVSAFCQVLGECRRFPVKVGGLSVVAVEFQEVGADRALSLPGERVVGEGVQQRQAASGPVRHCNSDGPAEPDRWR
jgi:hypothetical protein